ncbi:MAG TPA: SH3 domain-containing protein [Roseiflexaceae bacterium]|nr:SH3 domain-containing protein [Roseiflexaceae bacterium]
MTNTSHSRTDHDLVALQRRAVARRGQHRQTVSLAAVALRPSAGAARLLTQSGKLPARFLLHTLVALVIPIAVVLSQLPLLQPRLIERAALPPVDLPPDALELPAPLTLEGYGERPVPDAAFAEIDALPVDRFSSDLIKIRPPTASVIAEQANLRNGPGTNYDSVGMLAQGTLVQVLARHEDWYHAQQSDGRLVWVAAELLDLNPTAASLLPDALSIPAPPPPRVALVRQDKLNLRDGPGTNYIGMTQIDAGAQLDLLARFGDWFQVQAPGAAVGWVRADLLEIAPGVVERVEVVASPPDPNPELVGVVRGNTVNLRGGPSTEYAKLGSLAGGAQLDLLGRYQDWVKVQTPKGTVGWISRELVEVREYVARRVPTVKDIPALPKPQRAPSPAVAQPQRAASPAVAQPPRANSPAPAPAPAPPPPVLAGGSSEILSFALQFVGVPYVWGGESPKGFDCSGFTRYVYRQFGVNLPHSAEGQFSTRYGAIISSASDLRPGDLVFFVNTYKRGISHVGIYAGDGMVLQALSPGRGLAAVSMNTGYWSSRYYSGLRPGA